MIHIKHQALFSSKDKSKKIKALSATIFVLFGTLRVKIIFFHSKTIPKIVDPSYKMDLDFGIVLRWI